MTVVQYEQPQPLPLPPSRPGDELERGPVGDVARLRAAAEYAGLIANTAFVPDTLRGKTPEVTAAIVTGRELGLDPMASLRTISIIRGRPTLSAEGQRALVTSQGHELWFDESTTTRAIAAGRRQGSDRVGRVTWTLDDAKRAGLANQPSYRSYPAEMLRARASAALIRTMFADVLLGIAATEELEDGPDNGPTVPDTPPPGDAPKPKPATRTRRRTPKEPEAERPPVAPTPPPDAQPEPTDGPPPATDATKRKLFALMRDAGLDQLDRDQRLAYTARVIGRVIESSNDLTQADADLVIQDLQALAQLPAAERTTLDELRQTLGARDPVPFGELPADY